MLPWKKIHCICGRGEPEAGLEADAWFKAEMKDENENAPLLLASPLENQARVFSSRMRLLRDMYRTCSLLTSLIFLFQKKKHKKIKMEQRAWENEVQAWECEM